MTSPDLALSARPDLRCDAPATPTVVDIAIGMAIGALVVGVVTVLASPTSAVHSLAVMPGLVAAIADRRTRRIPDRWVVIVLATSMAVVGVAAIRSGSLGFAAAATAGAVVAVLHLAVHLATPSGLGFGDVKLAAAIAVGIGPAGSTVTAWVLLGVSFTAAATAGSIVISIATRRRDVAYAPALVAALPLTLLAAHHLPGVVPT